MRRLILVPLAALLALACNDDGTPVATGDADDRPVAVAADTVLTGTGTVLESPDHGPQLCLGGVDDSYPPQCGGPDIIGWDWSAVEAESASGTTWGTFTVVGTYDGTTFTMTRPAGPPDHRDDGPRPDFSSPCDAPEGGWAVVDETTATEAGQDAARTYAQAQPDFAGLWVDQSINPAAGADPVDEFAMNDPTKLVLNVRFTGDLAAHEAALRSRFGGALCVSGAERTEADLRGIQDELTRAVDGFLFSSTDIIRGVVEIGVVVADPMVQAELDETYGAGVVELQGALTPVDG